MYRWFSCRWLDVGDPEKLMILSGLPHLPLIPGCPIALGATARPTKPASSTVAGGRASVVEPSYIGVRHQAGFWLREPPGRGDGVLHSLAFSPVSCKDG